MKRALGLILVLLLLVGCQKIPPAAPPAPPKPETPPVEEPKAPEQETVVPQPEPPEETVMPEEEVDPAPIPQPVPAPEPEPDWCAKAMEAYVAVTDREQFLALVQEADGTATELTIVQGMNDWNVEGLEYGFSQFDWSAAAEEDWDALADDLKLSLYVPGEISFSCTQNGDIVKITTPQETVYLRAVNSEPEADVFLSNLYSLLDMVPEDACGEKILSTPADGTLEPEAAAAALAEAVVSNYLVLPDWVSWKPVDVRVVSTEVFDVYRGMPEQICFNMGLEVKIEDPMAPEAIYWQAGAGLDTPDEEGFCGWDRQVLAEKNEDGNWVITDWGTGGYSVNPQKPEEKPQLDWLVELFCLTEGFTHDQIVPYLLLERSDEEIATLPAILDQLTEAEALELCAALGNHLREADSWRWSIDLLAPLLGEYGAYLDT